MPQFLVAMHLPDNYVPPLENEAMVRDVHALNKEMISAGIRVFACGLSPASSAKSLRAQPDGEVIVTDGPYLEAKEHIGGLSILDCADMNEALAWARRGAVACRMPGEVREMLSRPPTSK